MYIKIFFKLIMLLSDHIYGKSYSLSLLYALFVVLCVVPILYYFPILGFEKGFKFASDCTSSWSLLTFTFVVLAYFYLCSFRKGKLHVSYLNESSSPRLQCIDLGKKEKKSN